MRYPCRSSAPLRYVPKLPNTAATSAAMSEPSNSTKKLLCTARATARSARLNQCMQCVPFTAAVFHKPDNVLFVWHMCVTFNFLTEASYNYLNMQLYIYYYEYNEWISCY